MYTGLSGDLVCYVYGCWWMCTYMGVGGCVGVCMCVCVHACLCVYVCDGMFHYVCYPFGARCK